MVLIPCDLVALQAYWQGSHTFLNTKFMDFSKTFQISVCWCPQTLVSSTNVMPGHRGRQYMEWGIMGYSPSLSETSKKTLWGVEGSGGGTSRVCRLSSAIWWHHHLMRLWTLNNNQPRMEPEAHICSHLDVWVHELKHRGTSSHRLLLWIIKTKTAYIIRHWSSAWS